MIRQDASYCRLFTLFCLVMAVSATAMAKRTDDVVVMKNGDRFTGEIKSLLRGELAFKADYMAEAVKLDWSKVARLESRDTFQIMLTDGQLFTDYFNLAEVSKNNFVIVNQVSVDQMDVIRILPVERNFWSQLQGKISLGLNFTSGNDQYQTDLSASVTYRKEKQSLTTAIDSSFSGQTQGSKTARNEVTVDYRRQLSPKMYAGGLFDGLRSDQQDLSLRLTGAGLVGRNIIQSERTRLSVFGGLAVNREKYRVAPAQNWKTNVDALVGFDFTTFRFAATELQSGFLVYPSLTTPGRTRTQVRSDLSYKIAKDFWWGLHLYENFDSKPPIKADKNDLGISASISWKF